MPGRAPSEHEVIDYLKTLSNWGRWGAEDELGTINLITPAKRAAAARLVQDGVAVTGARPIVTDITADTTFQFMRFMVDSGEGRDTAPPERVRARRGAGEFIGMVFHGYTVTHIDTPAHFFWEGKIYNGRSCNLITSREGATVEAVELLHDGVVSRGVLLDVARTRGVRWLEPGEGVMPEDLRRPSGRPASASSPATSWLSAPATTRGGSPKARRARSRRGHRARMRRSCPG